MRAVPRHADRHVRDQADRHARAFRCSGGRGQAVIRTPLGKGVEGDRVTMIGGETRDGHPIGIVIRFGPGLPALCTVAGEEIAMKGIEDRLDLKRLPLLVSPCGKARAILWRQGVEGGPKVAHPVRCCHAPVDQCILRAGRRACRCEPDIAEMAAGRRIGAEPRCVRREERMNRADRQGGGPRAAQHVCGARKAVEIAIGLALIPQ
jgi:hypothetical protein